MGVGTSAARHIMQMCRAQRLRGSVLGLGRITFQIDEYRLNQLLDDYNFYETAGFDAAERADISERLNQLKVSDSHLSHDVRFRAKNRISDFYFFAALGFDVIESVDKNKFDGSTYSYDLNQRDVSTEIPRKYNLVIDAGTMEHVFDTVSFLKNVFDLLEIGGCVIHHSPSNNHCDHGYFQFSPQLFHDYYTANRFDLIDLKFVRQTTRGEGETDPWMYCDWKPGCLDAISFGGLDQQAYMTAACARKTAGSTWDGVPSQLAYAKAWKTFEETGKSVILG